MPLKHVGPLSSLIGVHVCVCVCALSSLIGPHVRVCVCVPCLH